MFTYDPDTDRGRVRLLVTDTEEDLAIFDDAEVDTFLTLMGSNILKAAALALETIAGRETLIQKRIKLLDLQTDGPAEAAALLAQAKRLREAAAEMEEAEVGAVFDYAEMVVDAFTRRERREKEALRGG